LLLELDEFRHCWEIQNSSNGFSSSLLVEEHRGIQRQADTVYKHVRSSMGIGTAKCCWRGQPRGRVESRPRKSKDQCTIKQEQGPGLYSGGAISEPLKVELKIFDVSPWSYFFIFMDALTRLAEG